jgi:hypothetical protein
MPEPTQEQIQAAIAAVAQRAAKDQAFREKVLKEPIVALNEAGNLDLPLNTPIRFADKFEKLVIVLPPFGSDPNEITDEEMLSSVSGGITPTLVVTAVTMFAFLVNIGLANQNPKK